MQGSDYDEGLVHHHEEGWHHWTKFMLWSVISIAVLLLLMAGFLID
ncbi:hypothetical protein [Thalassospira sp.]